MNSYHSKNCASIIASLLKQSLVIINVVKSVIPRWRRLNGVPLILLLHTSRLCASSLSKPSFSSHPTSSFLPLPLVVFLLPARTSHRSPIILLLTLHKSKPPQSTLLTTPVMLQLITTANKILLKLVNQIFDDRWEWGRDRMNY